MLKSFGQSVLLPSGEIDRDKLGELVFNDKVARRKLNAATHLPVAVQLVRQLALKWLGLTCVTVSLQSCLLLALCILSGRHCAPPFQVVDMPLLFETGAHKLMWPRVFVTCSHKAEVILELRKRLPVSAGLSAGYPLTSCMHCQCFWMQQTLFRGGALLQTRLMRLLIKSSSVSASCIDRASPECISV